MKNNAIKYPYLPKGRSIEYAPETNAFMQEARALALTKSLDDTVKTGAVIVKDAVVIGRGSNGSNYHKTHKCERVRQNVPTGEGYELCEGCSPKNHAEPRAIANAVAKKHDTKDADLYLWGHWWCCESCWSGIIQAGIARVILMEGSEVAFNKENSKNILGRW